MNPIRTICLSCIGDDFLRGIAKAFVEPKKCGYCQTGLHGIPLGKLAEIVSEPLSTYCCPGDDYPEFLEDSDKTEYEQEGDSLNFILQEELGIDYEPANDLIPILETNDPLCFFDSSQNYHRRDFYPVELKYAWSEFRYRVCHERRFFDDKAGTRLAEILGIPGSEQAKELPTKEIGRGTGIESIFRARRAENEEKAQAILRNPGKELGPPPAKSAPSGKMNPAGISVFYGALSVDTAIAEVRPSVGSLVVVARFFSSRVLRLLDLTQLGTGFTGSIFNPGYEEKLARLRFLEGFHTLIAKPVQPHDEPIDYIPTQAVAEYVANVLNFDGMLFASAQLGSVPEPEPTSYAILHELSEEELLLHNVVLLGEAARVNLGNEPKAAPTEDDFFKEEWTPPEPREPPALSYCADSAYTVRITAVNYQHERNTSLIPTIPNF